jgi:hypothetical protein
MIDPALLSRRSLPNLRPWPPLELPSGPEPHPRSAPADVPLWFTRVDLASCANAATARHRRAVVFFKLLKLYANEETAEASSSLTSNTVTSFVITSRSRTLLVRFSSFSSPPAFFTAV